MYTIAEFDPQQGDVMLTPTYRSGTHIHLGQNPSATTVMLMDLLVIGKVLLKAL
jgi:hypothetical protein